MTTKVRMHDRTRRRRENVDKSRRRCIRNRPARQAKADHLVTAWQNQATTRSGSVLKRQHCPGSGIEGQEFKDAGMRAVKCLLRAHGVGRYTNKVEGYKSPLLPFEPQKKAPGLLGDTPHHSSAFPGVHKISSGRESQAQTSQHVHCSTRTSSMKPQRGQELILS